MPDEVRPLKTVGGVRVVLADIRAGEQYAFAMVPPTEWTTPEVELFQRQILRDWMPLVTSGRIVEVELDCWARRQEDGDYVEFTVIRNIRPRANPLRRALRWARTQLTRSQNNG